VEPGQTDLAGSGKPGDYASESLGATRYRNEWPAGDSRTNPRTARSCVRNSGRNTRCAMPNPIRIFSWKRQPSSVRRSPTRWLLEIAFGTCWRPGGREPLESDCLPERKQLSSDVCCRTLQRCLMIYCEPSIAKQPDQVVRTLRLTKPGMDTRVVCTVQPHR
jgi:hypothetical protein